MNSIQQKMISRTLMNVTGYPVPDIDVRKKVFHNRLDWCIALDEKMDKLQDLRIDEFNPSPEEQWIILKALKFVLKEYDDNDFAAVMDYTRKDYARLYANLDSLWLQTAKEPSENYRVSENL